MKYEFIEIYRSTFSVEKMCQTLDVSRSGYYRWRRAPESERAQANAKLLQKIKETYERFQGVYGSPRITQELRGTGVECSENRVARLMRENEIAAKTKRKFKVTTNSRHNLPVAPNLVNQEFTAAAPNQLWLSDITYIWTREGWLDLAALLDVFSRQIVGWSMNKRMTKDLVLNALKQALGRRSITSELIFHSDRGSQYAAHEVRKLLEQRGIKQSMSKKGDCYDNAMMESFISSLKRELIYPFPAFENRNEAKSSVFYYIEIFYNKIRRHSGIGNIAPAQFEKLKQTNAA
jgi:putative transposase